MAATPLNLDTFKAPTAKVQLEAGKTYTCTKGIDLGNATWEKLGTGPDPIVKYTGPRDAAAMRSLRGNKATVKNVTVIGSPWTYGFEAQGGLTLLDCKCGGGAGAFKTDGASGPVIVKRFKQLANSANYIAYASPFETDKPPVYTEVWNESLELEDCEFLLGSGYMAGLRAQAFKSLKITRCKVSDVGSQSAINADGTKAVDNAVLRIHYGGKAEIIDSFFYGEVFLGPLNGKDGGIGLPPGAKRDYRAKEMLYELIVTNTLFDGASFKIAPGVALAKFVNCGFKGKPVTFEPFPYLDRVKSKAEFGGCYFTDPTGKRVPLGVHGERL